MTLDTFLAHVNKFDPIHFEYHPTFIKNLNQLNHWNEKKKKTFRHLIKIQSLKINIIYNIILHKKYSAFGNPPPPTLN
jgi:hypothetical protein